MALLLSACFVDRSGLGDPDGIDAALPDASGADARPDGEDAGPTTDAGRDAGPVGPDAGPDEMDAGPEETDAGPPDAGPPDAGPPDTGPPDAGPPPCDDIYGGVEVYHRCAETATECEFYVDVVSAASASCDTVCSMGGGSCVASWSEDGDTGGDRCVHAGSRTCGESSGDMICRCTRPHLP